MRSLSAGVVPLSARVENFMYPPVFQASETFVFVNPSINAFSPELVTPEFDDVLQPNINAPILEFDGFSVTVAATIAPSEGVPPVLPENICGL